MSKDITFCSGLRCNKTHDCERWVGHITPPKEDAPPQYISIAQFADHDGKCTHWIEKLLETGGRNE